MRRHRTRLFAGLAGLAVVAVAVLLLWPRPPAYTWDEALAIRPGATRAEVLAVLGGPPRDSRRDRSAGIREPLSFDPTGAETWLSDGGMLYVWFDGDDRVTRTHGEPCFRDGQNLLQKIWWRFKP